jgi:hypothetical protein
MGTLFPLSTLLQFSQDDSLQKNRIQEMEVLSYKGKARIRARNYTTINSGCLESHPVIQHVVMESFHQKTHGAKVKTKGLNCSLLSMLCCGYSMLLPVFL